MARPLYLICSESGSLDRDTGRVSVFNVIEKLRVGTMAELQKTPGVPVPLLIHVVAGWARETEEMGEEFEYQLAVSWPGSTEESIVMQGSFAFRSPFHRFLADIVYTGAINQPGEIVIESRVRRHDTGEWQSQRYPIELELLSAGQQADPTERDRQHAGVTDTHDAR